LPELPQEGRNDWSRELLLCEVVTVESRIGAVPIEYGGKADQKNTTSGRGGGAGR